MEKHPEIDGRSQPAAPLKTDEQSKTEWVLANSSDKPAQYSADWSTAQMKQITSTGEREETDT